MDNDSKYTFNGSQTLDKVREDFAFCEVWTDDTGQKLFVPVSVGEVRVTVDERQSGEDINKPLHHHLIAKCWSEASGDSSLDYIISKKTVRKVRKTKHIDVRMTDDLYSQICKDAKACKLDPSAYLRELAKKKHPRKALSEEDHKRHNEGNDPTTET